MPIPSSVLQVVSNLETGTLKKKLVWTQGPDESVFVALQEYSVVIHQPMRRLFRTAEGRAQWAPGILLEVLDKRGNTVSEVVLKEDDSDFHRLSRLYDNAKKAAVDHALEEVSNELKELIQ